jgi:hypothetical protein
MCGTFNFTGPVNLPSVVMLDLVDTVDMAKPSQAIVPPVTLTMNERPHSDQIEDEVEPEDSPPPERGNPSTPHQINADTHFLISEPSSGGDSVTQNRNQANVYSDTSAVKTQIAARLNAGDFLTIQHEKLIYRISMLGVPVGNAELDSRYENGEVWITLRIKSNAAISTVFPVDDFVETRHIDGKFIMATIKQQEGSFRSDEGFTINLRKKRVSWFDNIGRRNQSTSIPTDQVLDTLSGIYYLRNRHLKIGTTEVLHVFDSEIYSEVPVEILRRESLQLPNLTTVDTLVIRPLQKTAGMFRRTGDIQIWITDDEYKVPVKITTTVALGTITVELVSAESTPLKQTVPAEE